MKMLEIIVGALCTLVGVLTGAAIASTPKKDKE